MRITPLGGDSKFRGPSPGSFRVRGLPRNPDEQTFTLAKLWKYVEAGKMFFCTPNAIPATDEYPCSPPTTVDKKNPWPDYRHRQTVDMGWETG